MSDERLKIWLELGKWSIGSVAIVIATIIIDSGFKDRQINVTEMEQYYKFINYVANSDSNGLGKLRSIAEFYKIMTISEKAKECWESYYDTINRRYNINLAKKDSTDRLRDSLIKKAERYTADPDLNDRILVLQASSDVYSKALWSENKPDKIINTEANPKTARYFEKLGLNALINGRIDEANEHFKNCEASYPSYHNALEISNLLTENAEKYNNSDEKGKKAILFKIQNDILNKFSWGLTSEDKKELEKINK